MCKWTQVRVLFSKRTVVAVPVPQSGILATQMVITLLGVLYYRSNLQCTYPSLSLTQCCCKSHPAFEVVVVEPFHQQCCREIRDSPQTADHTGDARKHEPGGYSYIFLGTSPQDIGDACFACR